MLIQREVRRRHDREARLLGAGRLRAERLAKPARSSEWVRRALHSDVDQRAGADSLTSMGTPEITA